MKLAGLLGILIGVPVGLSVAYTIIIAQEELTSTEVEKSEITSDVPLPYAIETLRQRAGDWGELADQVMIQDPSKIERLSDLGFSNAQNVRELRYMQQVLKWREVLPEYPFVVESDVKELCQMYSLKLGKSKDFTGRIPSENIFAMLAFADEFKETFPESIPSIPKPVIAAPVHMFDMRGMVDDYRIVEVKDPIVLQEVDGGYLLVTAWDEEPEGERFPEVSWGRQTPDNDEVFFITSGGDSNEGWISAGWHIDNPVLQPLFADTITFHVEVDTTSLMER